MSTSDCLSVKNLHKSYSVKALNFLGKKRNLLALQDISFELRRKEVLAVVGESGCGKSTLAKCLLGIEDLTSGEITLSGQSMNQYSVKTLAKKSK